MARTGVPERFIGEPLLERSGVSFSYARKPEGLEVTISKGAKSVQATLEWVFGSGAQAITPVGRYRGDFFEHRISYYTQLGHPARTIGHSAAPSPSPEAALGLRQKSATIGQCFGCHATAVRPGPDLSAMIPGVTCERCHGPGSEHIRQPAEAKMRRTASVDLCAECHRTSNGAVAAAAELADPVSVRFQPVGLSASACFRKSGRLTCVSCHDPHEDAQRSGMFYQKVCLRCHTTAAVTGAACRRNEKQDCLPCHMRKSTPLPYLTFTDHRIRVY